MKSGRFLCVYDGSPCLWKAGIVHGCQLCDVAAKHLVGSLGRCSQDQQLGRRAGCWVGKNLAQPGSARTSVSIFNISDFAEWLNDGCCFCVPKLRRLNFWQTLTQNYIDKEILENVVLSITKLTTEQPTSQPLVKLAYITHLFYLYLTSDEDNSKMRPLPDLIWSFLCTLDMLTFPPRESTQTPTSTIFWMIFITLLVKSHSPLTSCYLSTEL